MPVSMPTPKDPIAPAPSAVATGGGFGAASPELLQALTAMVATIQQLISQLSNGVGAPGGPIQQSPLQQPPGTVITTPGTLGAALGQADARAAAIAEQTLVSSFLANSPNAPAPLVTAAGAPNSLGTPLGAADARNVASAEQDLVNAFVNRAYAGPRDTASTGAEAITNLRQLISVRQTRLADMTVAANRYAATTGQQNTIATQRLSQERVSSAEFSAFVDRVAPMASQLNQNETNMLMALGRYLNSTGQVNRPAVAQFEAQLHQRLGA